MLVLQATNTWVRRPGYKATQSTLVPSQLLPKQVTAGSSPNFLTHPHQSTVAPHTTHLSEQTTLLKHLSLAVGTYAKAVSSLQGGAGPKYQTNASLASCLPSSNHLPRLNGWRSKPIQTFCTANLSPGI